MSAESQSRTDPPPPAKTRVRNSKRLNGTSIQVLPIPVFAKSSLLRAGVATVGEVRRMSADDLRKIRGFGHHALDETRRVLAEVGVFLRGEDPAPPDVLIAREKLKKLARGLRKKRWLLDAIVRGRLSEREVADAVISGLRTELVENIME